MSLAPVCPMASPSVGHWGLPQPLFGPWDKGGGRNRLRLKVLCHPEEEIILGCASVSPLAKEEKCSENFEKSLLGAHIVWDACGPFS